MRKWLWYLWSAASVGLATYLGVTLLHGEDRGIFLPGATSDGHYQIELACEACHTSGFGGGESLQKACMGCHGAELERGDDSHPKSKFTDPRNAALVEHIDARRCTACHVEHQPQITRAMQVTLPADFCVNCHQDVAEERPSHAGMGFETCASAGCHNYHNNRALYEDFLVAHLNEPATLEKPRNEPANSKPTSSAVDEPAGPLSRAQHDAPETLDFDPTILARWASTAHAEGGVNCTDCHATERSPTDAVAAWVDRPRGRVCADCHALEVEGFARGRHGMRMHPKLEAALSPMSPSSARLPMKAEAADRSLTCTSCHGAHRFDTQQAAVEGCLGCHNDDHSLAYKESEHYALWQAERAGEAPADTGVSCATCHLPTVTRRHKGHRGAVSQHNQNATLRPIEKMIRPVCMDCHGLGFSIDALADPRLIERNFAGRPGQHVESLDMAAERIEDPKNRGQARD